MVDKHSPIEDTNRDSTEISIHAMTDHLSSRTIRVKGLIGGQAIQILTDGGSTHNFIQSRIVQQLSMRIHPAKSFRVMVGNEETLHCTGEISQLPVIILSHEFVIDCYVLPIEGAELILGVQWLELLGPIITDFKNLTMEFTWHNQRVKLIGESIVAPESITLHQFKRLVNVDMVSSCLQLWMFGTNNQQLEVSGKVPDVVYTYYKSLSQYSRSRINYLHHER